MPRMNILNTVEREAFESPPVFNSVQRKQYFDFPTDCVVSRVSFAPQPTNWAFC